MLLLGLVLVFLLTIQLELFQAEKASVVGGLLWLAIFFSATLAFDHSFADERQNGTWQALTLYPINPAILFLAKMAANILSLLVLEAVIIPAFIVFSDVPLLVEPASLILIAALSNIGIAAVGTLVSALTAGQRHRGGLLAILHLPLVTPVVLGSAKATEMALTGQFDSDWRQCVHLLGVFAMVFTVAGALAFEFVIEE
jgi:heme exporter protein B